MAVCNTVCIAAKQVAIPHVEYTPVTLFSDKQSEQQTYEQYKIENTKKESQKYFSEFMVGTLPGQVINQDAFFTVSLPRLTRTGHMCVSGEAGLHPSQYHIDYDSEEYDQTHPDKTLIETYDEMPKNPCEILCIQNTRTRHLPKRRSIICHQ
jgi:hypothetical protein